ncbi:hypothetical protein AB0469_31915 [Streptomyces sp. NPDC093801]|uniref:hypothetical protein n=1 Tax=Streptomyces sp. NPDC093801 TaxID=3155203 RepID=UPI00344C981F
MIPGWLLMQTVTIQAYLGDSAYGPQYAAPVTARARVEEQIRTVRDERGEEVTASTTVYLFPDQACPPESLVTTPSGRTASVITSALHSAPGLGTPDHREVTLT